MWGLQGTGEALAQAFWPRRVLGLLVCGVPDLSAPRPVQEGCRVA